MRYILLLSITMWIVLLSGCNATTQKRPSLTNLADTTDECKYMDRVCKEAKEFQKQYNAMPEDQKQDFIPVLNTMIEHCDKAAEDCRQTL